MKRLCTLAMLVVLALPGCGEEPTLEQQIIGTINELEELAEAGERGDFMDLVDEAFAGQHGTLLRMQFERFMILQWNQHRRLYAQLFPITVRAEGPDLASARFKALITGGRGLLPDSGQLFQIETTFQKSGDDWLLLTADWEPIRAD